MLDIVYIKVQHVQKVKVTNSVLNSAIITSNSLFYVQIKPNYNQNQKQIRTNRAVIYCVY